MPTDTTDTHPALTERLATLGCDPATLDLGQVLAPPATSAADVLLGAAGHPRLADELSATGSPRCCQAGQSATPHRRASARSSRGSTPARRRPARDRGRAPPGAARRRAARPGTRRWPHGATCSRSSPRTGAPTSRSARGCSPTATTPGSLIWTRRSPSSPIVAVPAAEFAYRYLSGAGRHAEAAPYRARLNRELDALDAADAERRNLSRADALQPHGLPPAELAELRGALARIEGVAHAYVARKRLAVLADDCAALRRRGRARDRLVAAGALRRRRAARRGASWRSCPPRWTATSSRCRWRRTTAGCAAAWRRWTGRSSVETAPALDVAATVQRGCDGRSAAATIRRRRVRRLRRRRA